MCVFFPLRSAGDIVPELGDLTGLRTLSLRDNHFTGTIPPELGQLTALRHLFLNNNKLRGSSAGVVCGLGGGMGGGAGGVHEPFRRWA